MFYDKEWMCLIVHPMILLINGKSGKIKFAGLYKHLILVILIIKVKYRF